MTPIEKLGVNMRDVVVFKAARRGLVDTNGFGGFDPRHSFRTR